MLSLQNVQKYTDIRIDNVKVNKFDYLSDKISGTCDTSVIMAE